MITNGKVIVQFEKIDGEMNMNVTVNDQETYAHIVYQSDAPWTKDLKHFTGSFYSKELNTTYQISEKDGQLIMTHPRIGAIEFRTIVKNSFAGNRRYFNQIRFEPDHQNKVSGFHFDSYGGDTYWFSKIPMEL